MKKNYTTAYVVLNLLQIVLSIILILVLAFLPFGKIGELDMPNLLNLAFKNEFLKMSLFLPLIICVLSVYLSRFELSRTWMNFGTDIERFKKYYSKTYLVVKLIFAIIAMVITLFVLDYTVKYLGVENSLFYVLIIVENIIYCAISIIKQNLICKILNNEEENFTLEIDEEEYSTNVNAADKYKGKLILTIIASIVCMCLISSQLIPSLSLSCRPFQFYNVNFINVYDANFETDSKFLSSLKFSTDDDYNINEGVHIIEYYSNNISYIDSVIEKLKNDLNDVNTLEDGMSIAKQIDDLKNIKENLTCGYIFVKYKMEKGTPNMEFGGNQIGYYYSSIIELKYDTKMNDGVDIKWGVKEGLNSLFCKEEIIMNTEFPIGTDFSKAIPIKVKYNDGSVKLSYVVASNYEEINGVTSGKYKFKWEDEWGNYEKEITIT